MVHAGGRPTDYRPEYCERVIAMGKEGKSKAQMAVALDCVRTTLDLWAQAHPEFMVALLRAKEESQAYWEEQGSKGLWAGNQFNSRVYAFSMAARFPSDYMPTSRTEVTSPDGSMSPTTLPEDVAKRLDRLQKLAEERKNKAALSHEHTAGDFSDLA